MNLRYKILNIRHEPHDLDDDVIYFYYDIHFSEPEELIVENYFLPYNCLLDFIKEKYPDFYQYINSVRKSIDGFGPCERRTMEAMGDDAVTRLYSCLEEYLLTAEWMEKVFLNEKELQNNPPEEQLKLQENAAKAFSKLSEGSSSLRDYQKRYRDFCESVTKAVREISLKVYPEIADLEPEQLKEFQYLFVREIQAMHERIDKLLFKPSS
ncbi:MAG: hypothetical protein ABI855_20525 [Bacteroidota bacterium]